MLLAMLLSSFAAAAVPLRLVGYVTPKASVEHIEAGRVSDLIFAFAHIDHGRVVVDPKQVDALSRLLALRKQHPGLRVLISVGGWKARGFSDAALTAASRQRFAESAVALLKRFHADGLDIDWEYPGHSESGIVSRDADRANFTALLQQLRTDFDAESCHDPSLPPHLLLTAALSDSRFIDHVDLAVVSRLLDWINLMSYDFDNALTPTTGHHAGLYRSAASETPGDRTTSSAVHQYLDAGVPAAKIVIGAAFYGRVFEGVRAQRHGLYQPYTRIGGIASWPRLQADFIGKSGFQHYWDAQAQAAYLWNPTTRTFVSYESPRALRAKVAYVRRHRLGGVMYWEQSLDPDNRLFDVLARRLHSHPLRRDPSQRCLGMH